MQRRPEHPLLWVDGADEPLSRGDLDPLLRRFGAWYLARGLRAGDAALVDAGANELAIAAVFGAMAVGVIPVCVPAGATRAQRDRSREALAARLELRMIADREDAVDLGGSVLADELTQVQPLLELPTLDPESDAAVLYSSGTTGAARACRISHRALYIAAMCMDDLGALGGGRRALVSTGVHTITGLRFALPVPALQDAMTVWLPPGVPASRMMAEAARRRCQFLAAGPGFVPAVLRDLEQVAATAVPGFPARIWVGGGAVPLSQRVAFTRALGVELRSNYGLTETCGTVGWWVADATGVDRWTPRPEAQFEVRRARPEDPVGQVCVRTPAAFTAYVGGGGPVDGFVETGDLGRIEPDGQLRLLGRVSRAFTAPDGEKVLLDEVETALSAVTGTLAHVGVVHGQPPQLVALVEQDRPFSAVQRGVLRANLPARAMPERVICRATLPMNANGKLDREACQQLLERE